jgi:hypothetical protein
VLNGEGLRLAPAIKESLPAVPVILVSGNLKSYQIVECAKKQFLPPTLVGVVRKVLQSTVGTNLPIDGPALGGALVYRTRLRVGRSSFDRRCNT